MRWAPKLLILLFLLTLLSFLIDRHLPPLSFLHPLAGPASFFLSPLVQLLVWPFIYLVFLIQKKPTPLSLVTFSVFFSYIATRPLKTLIGRARPFYKGEEGFKPLVFSFSFDSFPSGHAAISLALFASLAALYPKWKYPLLALGIFLPLSRVVLNKHHLSDVLAGETLGLCIAWLFYLYWNAPLDRQIRRCSAYLMDFNRRK